MNKKGTFYKFKMMINFLVWINSFLPKKINKFFLIIFRNTPTVIGVLIRYVLLKNICKKLGDNVVVYQHVVFDAPEMMEIGNEVSIHPFCYLAGAITIGDYVSIAHTTAFHSHNHTWGNKELPIKMNPVIVKRIVIQNDVWIACNCVILSGVEIGTRSVVAAGSIVTKSFEGNSIIAGNPAKILKAL
ncbi:acyltransferase [Flavobacterium sp. SUN046]|uniref:acyltransferase n=1 Tax=Flavobacterium sp. SUN046 TaxID=3002440 RepID=UPI002DBC4614|nr:acyltransferase [Flavobacterium sp. SUN046]MEC4050887.1 acyltransferase [Flavobacterium sp. SUN046]